MKIDGLEAVDQGMELLLDRVSELDKKEVSIGWFEDSLYTDGTPVAYIAYLNEFGQHARPFIRPAIDKNMPSWETLLAKQTKEVLAGNQSASGMFNIIGAVISSQVKNELAQGDHKPLSKVTLAVRKWKRINSMVGKPIPYKNYLAIVDAVRKGETGKGELGEPDGNTTPLQDTHLMIDTLTWETN